MSKTCLHEDAVAGPRGRRDRSNGVQRLASAVCEALEERRLLTSVVVSPDPTVTGVTQPLAAKPGHTFYVNGQGVTNAYTDASAITPNTANDLVLNVMPFDTSYSACCEGNGGGTGVNLGNGVYNLTNGITQTQVSAGTGTSPATGDGGANDASNGMNVLSDTTDGWYASYHLGTNIGALNSSPQVAGSYGYDISEIDVISGHQDYRTQMADDVLVQYVGSTDWVSLSNGNSFIFQQDASGSLGRGSAQMAITNPSGGPLAANVASVKFVATNSVTWLRELVVTGTSSAGPATSAAAAPVTNLASTVNPVTGSVTLTWTNSADSSGSNNPTYYEIQRSTSAGGPFTAIGTVSELAPGAGASFVDQSVTPGTAYYYQIATYSPANGGTFTLSPSTTEAIIPGTVGHWTQLTHTAPPGGIGTMSLLPDGSVIAALGRQQWAHLVPDANGSYVNGTWSVLASSNYSRLYDSTQVLPDGRLFVAGGEYGTGTFNGETYDPLTNSWTVLPVPLGDGIKDAESTLLPDGRVLISPVYVLNYGSTLLFDPKTNTFSQGPNLAQGAYYTDEQSFVKLRDGSVLTTDVGNTTSQRYIPSLNQWIADAPVPVNLLGNFEEGPGFLLPDGRAIFFGGTGNSAIYTPSGTTSPGTWAIGPSLPNGATLPDAPGAMLGDGLILLAAQPASGSGRTFYLYDPTSNSFSPVTGGPLNSIIYNGRMLDLPDGSVLVSGAGQWVFTPGDTPLAAAQPQITNVSANSDGTLTVSGTGLNGISAGAAYGDDAQMDSNYPIVRFTSASGQVYYGRSSDWTNTGVQTGSTLESTNITLPLGLPAGTYSLSVVANGVASPAVSLTLPLIAGDVAPTIASPATAGASPVTGTNTTLSAQGTSASGAAGLTYTWTTTSGPANQPLPTYSVNGSNAAATTSVTFYRAGSYTFRVTITDPAGLSVSSLVNVTVAQTESKITLTPANSSPAPGATQKLTAVAVDQFGNNMATQPSSFSWSMLSGTGSLTSTGLFTAPANGFTAVVQASDGITSGSATVGNVPSPWASSDIGSPSTAGAAYVSGSTFVVSGSGSDIGGTSDQFRFAYQSLAGDGTITARLISLQDTDNNAKAGLMIRNSLAAGSAMSFIYLTPPAIATDPNSPGWGLNVSNRTSDGASVSRHYYGGRSGINAPEWLRLVRTGNTIAAFHSADGLTWVADGTATLSLGSSVYVGLAATSDNTGLVNTATFDQVTVRPMLDSATLPAGFNTITLAQDTDHLHIDWTAGSTTGEMLLSDPNGLTITGNGTGDTIALDYSHGNPLPAIVHLNGAFTMQGFQTLNGTTLDLGTSTLWIVWSGLSDPLSMLQQAIKTGYNGGSWTGVATASAGAIVTSSGSANNGIGYADFADGSGTDTHPNTVELKYTVYGDANLDGTVNLADFLALTRHFGQTGGWDAGDFNYDQSVNLSDLLVLTRHFGQSLPPTLSAMDVLLPASGGAKRTATRRV